MAQLRPSTSARLLLLAGTAFVFAGTATAQSGGWRSHIHIGPPGPGDENIPGSFNQYFPPDYYPYPAEWYHWPTLHEALDQYGWFGRRACKGGSNGSDMLPAGPPTLPEATSVPRPAGVALIRVLVPAGANIWFDGRPTEPEAGPLRLFVTPPLEAERTFAYEIRARWQSAGKDVTQSRRVAVSAGDRLTVDFRTEIADKVRE